MTSLQAALNYIQDIPKESLSPVRQVSPGSIVVHKVTQAMYLCGMIESGKQWVLFSLTDGHVHGRIFDARYDTRVGLPIDGFVDNPEDYIIFYNGKRSNSLATCGELKTTKK